MEILCPCKESISPWLSILLPTFAICFSWHSYSQVSLNFLSVFKTPTTFILIYIGFYQLPSTLTPSEIYNMPASINVALILAQMLSKYLR